MYKCPKCKGEEIELSVMMTVYQIPGHKSLKMGEFSRELIDKRESAYCAEDRCGWRGIIDELIEE